MARDTNANRSLVVEQLVRRAADRKVSPPQAGRLMGKTGQWFRDIAAGRSNMLLRDAEELARQFGGRLTITDADEWGSLDLAISALPKDQEQLKRALRALVRAEREGSAYPEPKPKLKMVAEPTPKKRPAAKPKKPTPKTR